MTKPGSYSETPPSGSDLLAASEVNKGRLPAVRRWVNVIHLQTHINQHYMCPRVRVCLCDVGQFGLVVSATNITDISQASMLIANS